VQREYFSIIFNVKKCALYSIKYFNNMTLQQCDQMIEKKFAQLFEKVAKTVAKTSASKL
jgi:hypothetical protein